MAQSPFTKLSIRTGAVRLPEIGYILACDAAEEEKEIPHTKIFKWTAGTFSEGWANFDAHVICIVSVPDTALVFLGGYGNYGVHAKDFSYAGSVFDRDPNRSDYGMFRSITTISGKAYAVGLRGMVYRLDDFTIWTRMDAGLPSTFDITAIDGFSAADIYAVGYAGELWHFDGSSWSKIDLPTNVNLTCVKCAGDGNVYIAGYDGSLIRGKKSIWDSVAVGETVENFWDLEWFQGQLYLSTILFVYRLKDDGLELIDFGDDPPETCYHLSAAERVLWSIGSGDIMSFDGSVWSRVV